MKYRAEVMVNRKVVKAYNFDIFTHPKQVARKVVELVGNRYAQYLINILNEYGEVWTYAVKKNFNGFEIRAIYKYGVIMTKDHVDIIFSGNQTIGGML